MSIHTSEAARRSRPYIGGFLILITVGLGLAVNIVSHANNPDRFSLAAMFFGGAIALGFLLAFDMLTEISLEGIRRPFGTLVRWSEFEAFKLRGDSILLRTSSRKTIRLYWVQFRDPTALLKFIAARLPPGDSSGKSEQASPPQSSPSSR